MLFRSSGSRQDYIESVKLVMETYPHPVKVSTLHVWCETVRNKFYLWDRRACASEGSCAGEGACASEGACGGEIVALVKSYVTEHIPLTADFREFNRVIFNAEWSDRKQIVELCLALREQLNELRDRYDHVLERLRILQDKCQI